MSKKPQLSSLQQNNPTNSAPLFEWGSFIDGHCMNQTNHKIIDFRSRPASLHPFYGGAKGTPEYETARWLNRRTGSIHDNHFESSYTAEGFLNEIRDSGISHAVVVGRDTPSLKVSNDEIYKLTSSDPRLIGLGSVDPQAHDRDNTLSEIERSVKALGFKGINIEPGFLDPAIYPDNEVFFPVYDLCQSLGIPVAIMSGPTTPDLAFNDPSAVGRVARAFPNLSIVCYHGFWPKVDEIVGVAFRYANVYLCPDMYLFAPGSSTYIEAANNVLQDQFLFATSYPFRAMGQTVDDFISLPWKDAVLEKLLYDNAARILKI